MDSSCQCGSSVNARKAVYIFFIFYRFTVVNHTHIKYNMSDVGLIINIGACFLPLHAIFQHFKMWAKKFQCKYNISVLCKYYKYSCVVFDNVHRFQVAVETLCFLSVLLAVILKWNCRISCFSWQKEGKSTILSSWFFFCYFISSLPVPALSKIPGETTELPSSRRSAQVCRDSWFFCGRVPREPRVCRLRWRCWSGSSLAVCITSFLMQYLGSGVMETQLMLLFGTVWFVKLFCFM